MRVKLFIIFLLSLSLSPALAETKKRPVPTESIESQNSVWNDMLKDFYFEDKTIIESDEIFDFAVPYRAEDGAMVPIKITPKIPQTKERYIKKIWIIIDKNPKPLAGTFKFSPLNGKADLAMRIRVDAYSPVRIVAETSDDKLYMVSHYVKSSGGCSAPASSDAATALKRLGKIRLKTPKISSFFEEPVQTRLAISHPNTSGLQKDQVTTLFIPPHYISKIEVKFEGESIFSAETDISISENPNFKFYFVPKKAGTLVTEITDTKGNTFTQSRKLEASTN
ncbi:MAG: quinoprotein dehydrogenase-associated SoxYZ-like carrier [Cocleimonas sp.]|nr:quinoprotein dehydrogenase-associated SoxYZ-like carrier [Cocleimonas sp.]